MDAQLQEAVLMLAFQVRSARREEREAWEAWVADDSRTAAIRYMGTIERLNALRGAVTGLLYIACPGVDFGTRWHLVTEVMDAEDPRTIPDMIGGRVAEWTLSQREQVAA